MERYAHCLPINNSVYYLTLLSGGLAEIDAGSFNAFVSHKVSKESNIVTAFQKAFRKAVPERVRIYHLRVDAVFDSVLFQLAGNTPCGDTAAALIEENKPAVLTLIGKPGQRFLLQGFRDVDTAQLAAL